MAINQSDTETVGLVAWPAARRHLSALASSEYRLAAKAPTEFDRGRHAGRAEMAEELRNLPEALALLAEEDEREKRRNANVKADAGSGGS